VVALDLSVERGMLRAALFAADFQGYGKIGRENAPGMPFPSVRVVGDALLWLVAAGGSTDLARDSSRSDFVRKLAR
jgi:hypothetical protein